jgi:integrase
MAKITKAFIDKVQPPEKGYEVHWDDAVRGYGLRVAPPAEAGKPPRRVFFVMGRVAGKSIQFTIGPYGTYTEDQARKKAQSILQQMRDGIDPRAAKKADEAAKITLRQVADAYFARPGMLKDSTKAEMDRHIEQVFEKWKDRPIASLTAAECRKRFTEMATAGLRGKGPAPVQAVIAFTTLRTLCRWASEEYGILESNPVAPLKADMKKNAGQPREGRIETDQVGLFWHWLGQSRETARNADALAGVDLIAFLLLTGARRNEGAALEWRNVNLDEGWWHIEKPKNGKPVWLPLSSQAVELLRARKPADGDKDASRFVFPSRSKSGHIQDPRAVLARFAKHIKSEGISRHDLRRTFTDLGAEACGLDIAKMELLTAHVPQGVTQKHYLKTGDLRKYKPLVQTIGDWIEQQGRIAAAKASGANVVTLPQRA